MRVSRALYSKLIAQYELLKMRAAYILAERHLENEEDASEKIYINSTPESLHFEDMRFEFKKPVTEQEKLHQTLLEYEAIIDALLDDEKYEELIQVQPVYNALVDQWKRKYGTNGNT